MSLCHYVAEVMAGVHQVGDDLVRGISMGCVIVWAVVVLVGGGGL